VGLFARAGRCHVGLAIAVATMASCAADGGDTVESAPICGDEGAQRILTLSIDEEVDRVVSAQGAGVIFAVVAAPPPASDLPASTRLPAAVVAGDGCGETSATIAGARLLTATGTPPLSCLDQEARAIDEPASPPIPSADCRVAGVDGGLVVRAPGTAELWVHGPAGDRRRLVEDVDLEGEDSERAWWAGGPAVVVRSADGAVARIDAETGEARVVAQGVADMFVVAAGKWLVWQEVAAQPPGMVWRTDLEGVADDVALAVARLADEPHAEYGPYVVLRTTEGRNVFRIDDGAPLSLPPGTSLMRDLPQGRLWLHRDDAPYGERDEITWDPATGEIVEVFAGPGAATYADDGLEVHVPSAQLGIQVGTLVLAPWDGSGARTLAEEVGWQRRRLADGRVLSVIVDEDAQDATLGHLVLHDPRDGGRFELADGVLGTSLRLKRAHPFDGDLLWVAQTASDRGLWRIRIPPA
jgi:hypothetical protein